MASWVARTVWLVVFALILRPVLGQDDQKRWVPPPLRVHIPLEAAWKGMLETVEANRNLPIAKQDRAQGSAVTEFYQYSSGPLTESHIAKIGVKPKLIDGEWVRVKYQFEILMELVTGRETIVTVYANIKALKREFLGTEAWVDIPTNGQLEEELLVQFGRSLFGQSFNIREPKKGFWERDPSYVPDPEERIPKVVGPERRPPQ